MNSPANRRFSGTSTQNRRRELDRAERYLGLTLRVSEPMKGLLHVAYSLPSALERVIFDVNVITPALALVNFPLMDIFPWPVTGTREPVARTWT